MGTIQGYTGLLLGRIWGIRKWIIQGLNRTSGYFAVNNKEPDAIIKSPMHKNMEHEMGTGLV